MGEGGVFPQAGCNLSAAFSCKQAKVAVALLEHEVVCLPYLLEGGTKRDSGINEARFNECLVGIACLAVPFALCIFDVGGNERTPGRVVGRHDERCFSV